MTPRQFMHVVEIRTKAISVSTFACALAYSIWAGASPRAGSVVACLAAVLAVDMGTTAFDSYFDFLRGVDRADTNREEDKILVHDGVSPGAALAVALACFALAGVFGVVLALDTGFWIIPAGAVCLAAAFLYAGGPYPVSRTPLGELFAGGFLGTALFMIVWLVCSGGLHAGGEQAAGVLAGGAQVGWSGARIGWQAAGRAFWASIPGFFMVASILAVNNTCDIEGDRAGGRRTLPILLGRRGGELLVYGLGLAGFLSPAILALAGVLPMASGFCSGMAALVSFREYGRMSLRGFSHATKGPSMGSILKIFLAWSAGCIAGLAIGIAMR